MTRFLATTIVVALGWTLGAWSAPVTVAVVCLRSDGQPVASAFVVLTAGGVAATGLTDANGILDLVVNQSATGVLSADRFPLTVTRVSVNGRSMRSNQIPIVDGITINIEWAPGGVITGQVASYGGSVAGTRVRLEPAKALFGGGHPVDVGEPPLSTVTDAQGRFRLGGLVGREYRVLATPSLRIQPTQEAPAVQTQAVPTYFPGVISAADAALVAVQPGETIDVSLPVLPGIPSTIHGELGDGSALGHDADQVQVVPVFTDRLDQPRTQRFARIDDRRRFAVHGLEAGIYRLVARTRSEPPVFFEESLEVVGGEYFVRLDPRGHGEVRIRPDEWPSVPERADRMSQLRLVRTDTWPLVSSFDVFKVSRAETGGWYRSESWLPPGRYRLEVDRTVAQRVPWTVVGPDGKSAFATVGGNTPAEVTFSRVEKALGIRGTTASDRPHDVAGVAVVAVDDAWWYPGSEALVLTPIGQDGEFATGPLPVGDYVALPVARAAALEDRRALRRIVAMGQRFTVTAGDWVRIELK